MVTTKITVKEHLREYLIGKYGNFDEKSPIHFPSKLDIYMLIWNLMQKRPVGIKIDTGNLEICLPDRHGTKPPEYYNYLGYRSQRKIEQKLELLFWADFRDYVEYERHVNGTQMIECTHEFMKKYGIDSISEDALIKNYYRWRTKVRRHKKRGYNKEKFQ